MGFSSEENSTAAVAVLHNAKSFLISISSNFFLDAHFRMVFL